MHRVVDPPPVAIESHHPHNLVDQRSLCPDRKGPVQAGVVDGISVFAQAGDQGHQLRLQQLLPQAGVLLLRQRAVEVAAVALVVARRLEADASKPENENRLRAEAFTFTFTFTFTFLT